MLAAAVTPSHFFPWNQIKSIHEMFTIGRLKLGLRRERVVAIS